MHRKRQRERERERQRERERPHTRIAMYERENMWRQLLFFSEIPTSYLIEDIN